MNHTARALDLWVIGEGVPEMTLSLPPHGAATQRVTSTFHREGLCSADCLRVVVFADPDRDEPVDFIVGSVDVRRRPSSGGSSE